MLGSFINWPIQLASIVVTSYGTNERGWVWASIAFLLLVAFSLINFFYVIGVIDCQN